MSRIPKTVGRLTVAVIVVAVAAGGVLWWLSPKPNESVSETPVTAAFVASMREAGFPITISRAVSVSSYDGFHGDGEAVTAYRYLPEEFPALEAALQRKHPAFAWREEPANYVTSQSPWTLLPRELQPENGSSLLLFDRYKHGIPQREFAVDRAKGVFYTISSRD